MVCDQQKNRSVFLCFLKERQMRDDRDIYDLLDVFPPFVLCSTFGLFAEDLDVWRPLHTLIQVIDHTCTAQIEN